MTAPLFAACARGSHRAQRTTRTISRHQAFPGMSSPRIVAIGARKARALAASPSAGRQIVQLR
jgi:hypothetical protein